MTIQTAQPSVTEPLVTKTEYAVRTRFGGDEQILSAPDKTVMLQRVAELLDTGCRPEPLVRTVTAWQVDEAAAEQVHREFSREVILNTAQRYWEEEIGEEAALDELRPHAPQMSDHDRAERLGELISELEHQADVNEDLVAPEPDQDRTTLVDDAERRVNEAADALYGGAA